MPYIELGEQSRALGPGVLSIGSGAGAGWRIRQPGIAQLHALVMLERDGRALLSRGAPDVPLAVNGKELVADFHELRFGDRIALGPIELVYAESTHTRTDTSVGYLRDTRRDRLHRLGESNEIGRDLQSPISLQEPEVSRRHAEVTYDGAGYVLTPFPGAVTLLNGERLTTPATLRDGDFVSIGRTTLRFLTSLPANTAIEDGQRRRADPRVAQMQTMFMGALESRKLLQRDARKRAGRLVAMALGATALIAGLVTAYERSLASTRAEAASTTSDTAVSAPAGTPAPR